MLPPPPPTAGRVRRRRALCVSAVALALVVAAHLPGVRSPWPRLAAQPAFHLGPLPASLLAEGANLAPEAAAGSDAQATGQGAPFSHGHHVDKAWWVPLADQGFAHEYAQDCRGCHDFRLDEAQALAPASDLCSACHAGSNRRFEDLPREESHLLGRFPHPDHLRLDCRICHGPDAMERPPARLPDVLPVPEYNGLAYCLSCHGSEVSRGFPIGRGTGEQEIYPPAELQRQLTLYRPSEPLRASANPVFRHAAHLAAARIAEGGAALAAACLECHTHLGTALPPDEPVPLYDARACVDCHGHEVRFEARPRLSASLTASSFVHAQHLGREHAGQALDCTSCHSFQAELGLAADFGPAHAFHADAYQSCAECHSDWRVSDHGQLGSCRDCHAFDAAGPTSLADLGRRRAALELLLPPPGSFSFATHGHAELEREASCRDCHRVDHGQIGSRIAGRPFDHGTHLPADLLAALADPDTQSAPLAAHCDRCHPALPSSPGPAAFARGEDPAALRESQVHSLADCAQCHGSAPLLDPSARRPTARLVFSHADHTRMPDGQALDCSACHSSAPGPDGLLSFAPLPRAADCTACHGHGPDVAVPLPAGHGAGDAQRCAECHGAGIPAPGVPMERELLRVAAQIGDFIHPGPEDARRCDECHRGFQPSGGLAIGAGDTPPARRDAGGERARPRIVALLDGPHQHPHHPRSAQRRLEKAGSGDFYFADVLDPLPPLDAADQERSAIEGRNCLYCHWASQHRPASNPRHFRLGRNEQVRRGEGRDPDASWRVGLRNRREGGDGR